MKKSSQKLIMKLLIFVTLLAEQICISFTATGQLREKKKKNPGAKLNHSKLCPDLPTAFEKCLFSRHD